MRRREFIRLFAGTAVLWPIAGRAQQPAVPVIGILWPGVAAPAPPRMEAFREGLSKSGFVDGRNVAIEMRFARAGLHQLPELAADLVRLKVDVILASGDHAPRVAQQVTKTVPIVAFSDDILGAGLISTLSRPGGNMTGLTILSPELSVKRLEVLREIKPGISRVAALWDPTTGKSQVQLTENAARGLGIKLQVLEVRDAGDLDKAFLAAQREQAEALNVFASPFLASLYRDIIKLAAEHRLPAILSVEGARPSWGARLLWARPCRSLGASCNNRC
jgi:putative ABC transport system substrate-binding protein